MHPSSKSQPGSYVRLYAHHDRMVQSLDKELNSLEPLEKSKVLRWALEFAWEHRGPFIDYIRAVARQKPPQPR